MQANRKYISLINIFLVSLSLLGLQVALTRVFSVLFWYHFAFLVISLALLGFTGGGLILYLFREKLLDKENLILWLSNCFFGISVLFLIPVLTRIPLSTELIDDFSSVHFTFIAFILITLIPFIFAGFTISFILDRNQTNINLFYFANLLGSGIGCWLIIWILDYLGGGPSGVIISGIIALIASFIQSINLKKKYVLISVFILLFSVIAFLNQNRLFWIDNYKFYPKISKSEIILRRWNSLNCVDVFKNPMHFGLWAISKKYNGPKPEQLGVVIDSWAATSIFKVQREDKQPSFNEIECYKHEIFDYLPASFVYTMIRPENALIIGVGGGVDVLAALNYEVKDITAVDINPLIIEAVKDDFREYSGYIYHHPRVKVFVAEGRHFLQMQGNKKYDLLQLSGVDTYTASQAGAFALSENYIYTKEAFQLYLDHLEPDGILTMTRWLFQPPRHTLRICVIAYEAMKSRGIEKPENNIVIIASGIFSVIVIRKKPFTEEDSFQIALSCFEKRFTPIYLPHAAKYRKPLMESSSEHNLKEVLDNPMNSVFKSSKYNINAFYDFFEAENKEEFIKNYPFNITLCTDNNPFFFEHEKWSNLLKEKHIFFKKASGQMLLMITIISVLLIGGVFLLIPFFMKRLNLSIPFQLYFAGLGLSYILIETVLIQRFILFLGHPVYALSVIIAVLLSSSGLGSYFSDKIRWDLSRKISIAILSIVLLCMLLVFFLSSVFSYFLYSPLWVRILISVAILLPLGFCMGIPFPSGISRISKISESLLPHAWLLNAYASVLGSGVCLIIAMSLGFNAVIVISAIIYLISLFSIRRVIQ
ncbi:MAG: hypothetical protein JXA60_07140 [Candidatus Coatesbacteria bacterium]|nr:hypothetical protein [Candidatus Coatesbacteria bacterium]